LLLNSNKLFVLCQQRQLHARNAGNKTVLESSFVFRPCYCDFFSCVSSESISVYAKNAAGVPRHENCDMWLAQENYNTKFFSRI